MTDAALTFYCWTPRESSDVRPSPSKQNLNERHNKTREIKEVKEITVVSGTDGAASNTAIEEGNVGVV